MNKLNIVKILVPILVLVGIFAIIATTLKHIEETSFRPVEHFDFNTYVDEYISDSIMNQPRAASKQAYDHIYEIITTESSIVATTPSGGKKPILSQSDAEECYEKTFNAFFSVFSKDAIRLFASSSWGSSDLSNIETISKELLNRKGLTSTTKDSLNNYIRYTKGYQEAIHLLNSSNYCADVNSYKSYCKRADKFKGYPYQNNAKLQGITSKVAQNASESWRTSITTSVDDVCQRQASSFGSANNFYNNYYRPLYANIDDYRSNVNSSWGTNLKKQLDNKLTEVRNYYNSTSSY